MPSVLFVCRANQCRSPMAEVLFREIHAREGNLAGWRIESAGTWALEGHPADKGAQKAMLELGLTMIQHRTRMVSHELLQQFDLILTMEQGQKEALRVEFPGLASRIYMLSEMVGEKVDIADPIGGKSQDYREAIEAITKFLNAGHTRIVRLASSLTRPFIT